MIWTKAAPERENAMGDAMPWSMPVAVADIPDTGLSVVIVADEPARAAIVRMAGLRSLPRLEAAFDLVRLGGGRVKVTGSVVAEVGQACVVTLEPIDSDLVEPVDLVFASAPATPATDAVQDVQLDTEEEPPEPLLDGRIDLGALATEFLILGINPYPRKPGATFAPQSPPEAAEDHPFAALAALKEGGGGKDGGGGARG